MERIKLREIFITYLNREPFNNEYLLHGNKNENTLINEILVCDEYIKLKDNKMKIALLISGHIRQNYIKNSLSKLIPYDFDVFVHSWDNLGIKGSETNLNDKLNYERVESEILSLPNIKKFKIENNADYINSLENNVTYFNYSSPENFIVSQLYSINQTYKIFEEYSINNNIKYDVVIRCRFDCEFNEFSLSNSVVEVLNSNKIIFVSNRDCGHSHPDSMSTTCQVCETMFYTHNLKKVHNFPHSNVICDIFAFGSVNSMKDYCSLYDYYYELNESFVEDNLETINNDSYGINVKKEGNVYMLDRDNSGHLNSLYYLNCSYPERLLQIHLKDYLLPTSRSIKVRMLR